MSAVIRFAKTAFIAGLFVLILHPALADSAAKPEFVDVGSGHYDLWRAHNERILVFFGEELSFKRYSLVDMLNQYFTIASDVPGGVRYTVHEQSGRKTLVID